MGYLGFFQGIAGFFVGFYNYLEILADFYGIFGCLGDDFKILRGCTRIYGTILRYRRIFSGILQGFGDPGGCFEYLGTLSRSCGI